MPLARTSSSGTGWRSTAKPSCLQFRGRHLGGRRAVARRVVARRRGPAPSGRRPRAASWRRWCRRGSCVLSLPRFAGSCGSAPRRRGPCPRRTRTRSGLWLMPARQRTNIMPMSVRRIIAWPSWPAPDISSRGALPVTSVIPAACARRRRGAATATGFSWTVSMPTTTPRRDADAPGLPANFGNRRGKRLVVGGAHVDAEFRRPGDDVAGARARPESRRRWRPAMPCCWRSPTCSTSRIISAAPASASWRTFIGTVPAWPASPRTCTR